MALLIQPSFKEYVAKFDERKYPPAVYQRLVRAFGSPQEVTDDDIREAIYRKFGHFIKKKRTIPAHHQALITELQQKWPVLSIDLIGSPLEIFLRLRAAIGAEDRFVTVSFLLHLLRPGEIPIVDQHNFRAMNHCLMRVRNGWRPKSKPSEFDDLATLSAFMNDTLSSWRVVDAATVPATCDLDRFLMMFGRELKAMKRRSPERRRSKRLEQQAPQGLSGDLSKQIGVNRSIVLPFGGTAAEFAVDSLVEHLNDLKRDYIIQGQINCTLSVHPKRQSLDYWLRQNFTN